MYADGSRLTEGIINLVSHCNASLGQLRPQLKQNVYRVFAKFVREQILAKFCTVVSIGVARLNLWGTNLLGNNLVTQLLF